MSQHVVPVRTYAFVFVILLVLLALTVAVAWLPLGIWSSVVAMTIAVVKATLIVAYFMHLGQEDGLTRIVAASGVLWLLLLFTFLLSDYLTREDGIRNSLIGPRSAERTEAPAGHAPASRLRIPRPGETALTSTEDRPS